VKPLGPAVLLAARPRARLFHLVFGSHIGRALGADSGEKSGLASDIDTATVESLNALDPKRPIREAQAMLTRTIKWSWLKAWGMKIARHRGMKRAVVAVARRMAVVMHRMWVDGTDFQWKREEVAAV
jgi:hypothetical protein